MNLVTVFMTLEAFPFGLCGGVYVWCMLVSVWVCMPVCMHVKAGVGHWMLAFRNRVMAEGSLFYW